MMKKIFLVMLLISLVVFFSGCVEEKKEVDVSQTAIDACIKKCQGTLSTGQDLSNGPCLSNEIIDDWVCDVAHDPRQDVDNRIENQCDAFRQQLAHHFVEVDTNCNFIKSY